jgi:outer membrane receptor protein involved in Fe transport
MGLSGGGALDPLTHAADRRYNVDLLYANEAFAKDWGVYAELRYMHLDYTSGNGFYERVVSPPVQISQLRAAERRVSAEASGLYSGFDRQAIRLGFGYVWDDLYSVQHFSNGSEDSADFAPEKARTNRYLFVQDVWSLAKDWELTAGLRYDHYSDFGGTLNPRLALLWQGSDRLTTKLMYGQAFRAPSYQDLYCTICATQGNANLVPERSKTWDLAFAYRATEDLLVSLNAYQMRQSDLITAVAGTYQNVGEQTTQGITVEAQWQATESLKLSGSYTARHREDAQIINVPDKEAYLRGDWAFQPGWNWNVQANWVDQRLRKSTDTRPPVDAYVLVDTTLRYAPAQRWEFAASIRNLFDADARDYTAGTVPNDLPLPGRNGYVEMRYKF